MRGLYSDGLIYGGKFAFQNRLGYPYSWKYKGQFSKYKSAGAYIWSGDLTEGLLRYQIGGLIFGGVYTWRGLFSEFYGVRHTFHRQALHANATSKRLSPIFFRFLPFANVWPSPCKASYGLRAVSLFS